MGAKQHRGFSSSCPESDDCIRERRRNKEQGKEKQREGGNEGGRKPRVETGGRKGTRLSCQSRRVDEGGGGGEGGSVIRARKPKRALQSCKWGIIY